MKTRHILSIAISVILLCCTCIIPAFAAIPQKPDSYYVYDEADVISEESEEHIIAQNTKLSAATDAEIVIAAIKTTGGVPINEFALDMYIDWSIGDSGKLNGVLVLLAIEDDKYWVIPGTGIEDQLTSGEIRTMFDNCLEPYFAKKDYDRGAVGMFDLLIKEFEEIYDVNLNEVTEEEGTSVGFVILIIFLIIVGIVIIGFAALIVYRYISANKYRSKNYRPGRPSSPQPRRPQNPQNRGQPGALPRTNRPAGVPPRQGSAPRPAGTPKPGGNPQRRPGAPMPRQNGNAQRPDQRNRPPRP